MAIGRLGRYIGSALVAGAAAIGVARGADASPIAVPLDYRADTDVKVVGLKKYDALAAETVSSDTMNQTNGFVTFVDDIDVPSGWKLWFLDAEKQPVGLYIIGEGGLGDGWHDFIQVGRAIYGDMPSPPGPPNVDEGATVGDNITVIAQSPSNRFFESLYVDGLMFSGDDVERPGHNIRVTYNEIIPEPATLALMGLGAGIAALTRRGRKFRPEIEL